MKKKMLLLMAITLLCGCSLTKKSKEDITDICKEKDFDVNFIDDDEFVIKEDGVEYHFESTNSGVDFIQYQTKVDSKGDIELDSEKALVTVDVFDNDDVTLHVSYDSAYGFSGDYVFHSDIGYECKSDFSLESIDDACGTAVIHHEEEYYETITENFITQDELKKLYKRGMDICEEF